MRLHRDVAAFSKLSPADVLAADLVVEPSKEPVSPLEVLGSIISTLTLIRDETAALESSREPDASLTPVFTS